eukprot:CAMPEP_0206433474 /NCGR_PEP_ID=MMETSP0324_2-20121206/8554_1 /ASSEMBLY_ACC=CAM_ASM_000836 /TAXON_ID=2866 /ORGANISM="Crypthecodinium cohnii, Strain Seligo" /LENGTH=649 /DNA_ID=CAMNT_0053899745 /DNA_START=73 /DNA_END=2022 /DNA_ORIENTATION=-
MAQGYRDSDPTQLGGRDPTFGGLQEPLTRSAHEGFSACGGGLSSACERGRLADDNNHNNNNNNTNNSSNSNNSSNNNNNSSSSDWRSHAVRQSPEDPEQGPVDNQPLGGSPESEGRPAVRRTPPKSLLGAYFLISLMETFPITAFQSLLNDDLHAELSTVTFYYAVSFLPFMWKPLFGWISDTFPIMGRRRVPYIVICSVCCSALYIVTAFCVKSIVFLFIATFARDIFNAFLQLMIDAFLVDLVRLRVDTAASLQGIANGWKWAGTLLAQGVAYALYASLKSDPKSAQWLARPLIGATAAAPAAIALVALLLPEEPSYVSSSSAVSRVGLRFGVMAAIAQLNFALIGCKSLMDAQTWWVSVILLGTVSLLAIGVLNSSFAPSRCKFLDSERETALESASSSSSFIGAGAATDAVNPMNDLSSWRWSGVCLFCFLVTAIPTSGVALSQFQYKVLTADSYQLLDIVASVASLLASLVFRRGFAEWSLRSMFAAATLVAVAVTLLSLPFVCAAEPFVSKKQGLWSVVGAWALGSTFLGGIVAIFTVLPVDTLVTTVSGGMDIRKSGTAYAILLGLNSFGGTVGGVVAGFLVKFFGLDGANWSALPKWIVAAAAFKLIILPMLCLVPGGAASEQAQGRSSQASRSFREPHAE